VNEEPEDEQQEAPPKKPYATPRLTEYGRALDLTGGGTGSVQEGVEMAVMKFP
jgi:hypothetical protein